MHIIASTPRNLSFRRWPPVCKAGTLFPSRPIPSSSPRGNSVCKATGSVTLLLWHCSSKWSTHLLLPSLRKWSKERIVPTKGLLTPSPSFLTTQATPHRSFDQDRYQFRSETSFKESCSSNIPYSWPEFLHLTHINITSLHFLLPKDLIPLSNLHNLALDGISLLFQLLFLFEEPLSLRCKFGEFFLALFQFL